MGKNLRLFAGFVAVLGFLMVGADLGVAQAPTGTIAGAVSDATGGAIPKATVTVTNKATGRQRIMETGIEGLYSAPALLPSLYEVKVEAPGFRTLVREATVTTGSTTMVDVQLQVGSKIGRAHV